MASMSAATVSKPTRPPGPTRGESTYKATWKLNSVLDDVDTQVKVSSTLDKTSSKKNLLDGSDETCWSSAQGLPQHIHLTFPKLLPATHLALTFQGGFVGTTCEVYLASARPDVESVDVGLGLVYAGSIHPKEGNARQIFEIPLPEAVIDTLPTARATNTVGNATEISGTVTNAAHREWVKQLKLVFTQSSDPFGRIVVYNLELLEAQ